MEYNDMQKAVIDAAKLFIETKIAPSAMLIDEEEIFPMDNFKEMGKMGFLGIPYPEEYEGVGLDYITYTAIIKEIAKVCASTAMTLVSHTSLTCNPICTFGSPWQKQQFLKPLLTGEKIGGFALTEYNSGSDAASIQTLAEEKEDCFVVNGSKIFITNGNVGDIFIVAAKTAPKNGMVGISIFILEDGMPGFTKSGKKERKLGMRGSDTGELIFQDVKVPKENLVGRKNFGMEVLHHTLVSARLGMAAIAVGIAQGTKKHCLGYVRQRKQFDKNIYQFQMVKKMLADMEMNINAADMLLQKAALMKDRGENITKEASEAKLFASEMATKVTKDGVQLFGAYGYSREFPLERFYRDAKITEIGDGTSEIQRVIIADEMIKKASRGK